MSNLIGQRLYRRNQNKQVEYWEIAVSKGQIIVRYGVLNGNPIETIILNTESGLKKRYIDKIRQGYKAKPDNVKLSTFLDSLTVDLVDNNGNLKPMKAQPYREGCIELPAYAQPKINGVRCVAKWVKVEGKDIFDQGYEGFKLFSKEGLDYPVQHIIDRLNDLAKINFMLKELVFDGELYIPNVKVATIRGAAVNVNNEYHKKLSFIMFDLSMNGSQQERLLLLNYFGGKVLTFESAPLYTNFNFLVDTENMIYHTSTKTIPPNVYKLDTHTLSSKEQVIAYRDHCLNAGFEGMILRDRHANYGFGQRVKTMRKFKKELYEVCKVVDIICRNEEDKLPLFILSTPKGKAFEASCNGTHSEQRKVLANKHLYLNKDVEIKFYEYTITETPFHATVLLDTLKK